MDSKAKESRGSPPVVTHTRSENNQVGGVIQVSKKINVVFKFILVVAQFCFDLSC